MRKRKKWRSKKNIKKIIISVIIIIFLLLLAKFNILNTNTVNTISSTLGFENIINFEEKSVKENTELIENVSKSIKIEPNKLNILYLDVGQADSELIIYKDKTILIDAGNRSDGELIVNGIKALGISKLDYVIGTHIHEDHLGGMSDIVNSFEIGEYYMPYNTTTTASYYENLLESLSDKQENINKASIGDRFSIDDITCEIMCVDNNDPDDANEASIVLQINYGAQKYLFMGDAVEKNEEERNWEDIDVLKVGHHGSDTSSSKKFLNQILPEIAIIPVGENNSYNLPKETIINRFENIGTKIYRTDQDGTIHILSDGNSNEVIKIDVSFDGN